ncbi:hypothetical protein EUX98_g784 [Antrodiella citrinella]|uniref:Uncharacterized protein n=1 Tax=Antrodiella citrinella TaxID=2447956 RepID=A0A4S4N612_9APHY|nr:hypothetical protein EUX98_g784 [Antrodiella citrinella]
MASQLPPGWPSKPTANHVLTAVILVMSLALAAIICGFMVGCIMWRKKRREHARAQQDLEQKRPVFYDDSDNESEGLKRVRSQQRSWSKASARWRANIRISARRRRAQRSLATRESPNSSTTSLHTTSSSSSVSRRHTVSASSEILGLPPHPEEHETTEASRPTAPATASLPPSSPQPLPAHPPAYRTDSGRMSQERFSAISDASGARPYVTHLSTSSEREEARPSYLPSDVAHVATDDKGLLARMATMASAPPAESTSTFMPAALGTSSAAIYPSVPVLDEFEDELHFDDLPSPEPGFEDASSEYSDSLMAQLPAPSYSHDPSHTPFPLPPAKSRLAAPLFYEYPSSFEEDVIGTEPPCGPSAPPFEVAAVAPSASAPPLDLGDVGVDDGGLVPSAPPAAEDDAYAVYPDEEARVHTGVVAASLGGEETSSITTPSGRVAYGHRTPSGRNPPEYLP